MSDDNDSKGGKQFYSVAFCLMSAGFGAWLWVEFRNRHEQHGLQRPGLCVDGRRRDQPISAARVIAVDSKNQEGAVTMRCGFPVAMYPCLHELQPGQSCAEYASLPLASTPQRTPDDKILLCGARGLESKRCNEKNWDCATGVKCDGYEKTQRICAGMLRLEPYKCFATSVSATDAEVGYPVGIMIGALAFTLCSVLLPVCVVCMIMGGELSISGILMGLCGTACCLGVALAIAYAVLAAASNGLSRQNGANLTGLSVQEGLNITAALRGNNLTIPQEQLPPPGMPTWASVLMWLGIFCGFDICACISVCVCICCLRRGNDARNKAIKNQMMSSDGRDVPVTVPSGTSVGGIVSSVSGKLGTTSSDKSLQSGHSRKELLDLVKKHSDELSRSEVIGHKILAETESFRAAWRTDKR